MTGRQCFILFLVCSLGLCMGEESGNGSCKITLPESERSKGPKVRVDSSNIIREPNRLGLALRKPGAGTFAAAIGMPGERILWTPALRPGSLNRTRVTERISIPDRSCILFAEETGEGEGPFGTRIIVYDPLNLRCFRITEIPFRLRKITPAGSSGSIAGVRIPQIELEDTLSLVTIDLADSRILASIPLQDEPEELLSETPDRIWLRKKDGTLAVCDGKTIRDSGFPGGIRKMALRKGTGIFVRQGRVDFTAMENGRTLFSIPVSDVMEIVPGSDDGKCAYALVKKDISGLCSLIRITKDGVQMILKSCGDHLIWSPESKALYVKQGIGWNNIQRIDTVKYKIASRPCQPYGMRPQTGGAVECYFAAPAPDELIFVPSVGRPWRAVRIKNSWKKVMDE